MGAWEVVSFRGSTYRQSYLVAIEVNAERVCNGSPTRIDRTISTRVRIEGSILPFQTVLIQQCPKSITSGRSPVAPDAVILTV